MNIEQFFKPPYSIPIRYFLLYFKSGQYEKACCEIKYSFETCLQLCSEEFIHFLIEQSKPRDHFDSIFCTIAYSLNKQHMSLKSLINPDDFLLACTHCNAYVIAIILNQSSIKISPISNNSVKESALRIILDRNDPQLLLKCLQLVPDFVETEPQRTAPLYYVLEHKLDNLVDEMWILINYFRISENDLLIIARNWKEYSTGPLIPILEELFDKHMRQYQLYIEMARIKKSDSNSFITEPTDVTDINCLDAKQNMCDAETLRAFLTDRKKKAKDEEQHILTLKVDPQSTSILMVLPYALMSDLFFMLSDNLNLNIPLIGEEAVGEGPVQDMFNAYFTQISMADSYFESNENTTSLLPTNTSGDERRLHEKKCIFYGLGVVFLKILIDLRPIGYFQRKVENDTENDNEKDKEKENENDKDNENDNDNDNDDETNIEAETDIDENTGKDHDKKEEEEKKGSINCSLHPWIFQALLQKMETDPKKIFNEALLYDSEFYSVMYNYTFDDTYSDDNEKKSISDLVDRFKENQMYLNSRGIYYQALHDGFYLNYIEGLTPSEFKENLQKAKNELKDFYDTVKNISPRALQLLLVGPSIINADFLLSKFDYEPFSKVDTSGGGNDMNLKFLGDDMYKGKIYNESIKIFKNVMRDWCNEEYQKNIRAFLRYLSGVPTLSPLIQTKWKIAIDFSIENNPILMTWACDNIVRSPPFKSEKHCKKILLDTIECYKLDPVNRDTF